MPRTKLYPNTNQMPIFISFNMLRFQIQLCQIYFETISIGCLQSGCRHRWRGARIYHWQICAQTSTNNGNLCHSMLIKWAHFILPKCCLFFQLACYLLVFFSHLSSNSGPNVVWIGMRQTTVSSSDLQWFDGLRENRLETFESDWQLFQKIGKTRRAVMIMQQCAKKVRL